jgi:hypothetical protein
MSFMSGVRKASPEVFGNYLSKLVEGVFELTFDDPSSFWLPPLSILSSACCGCWCWES